MRLIDADALMEEFAKFVRRSNHSDFAPIPRWNDAVFLAESAPTVDAVERNRGEWVKNEDRCGWHCSCCKVDNNYAYSWNSESRRNEFQDNFCPNCGADMRGESNA